MKLHYSQTRMQGMTPEQLVLLPYEITLLSNFSLTDNEALYRFTTLWNYTTLKLGLLSRRIAICFTTLWNYTTLKLGINEIAEVYGFTTLWNYTTLKPYEIYTKYPSWFYYLMKLHYSQTLLIRLSKWT